MLKADSTVTTPTPFGFAGGWGYQQDAAIGLQLLGHRYYDPSTGRFLTRDPIGNGRNWYAYCDNNPLRYVDQNGLDHFVIVVGEGDPMTEEIFAGRFVELARRWAEYLNSKGHTVTILWGPTKEQMRVSLKRADGLIYIGHGYKRAGNLAVAMNRRGHSNTFGPDDMREVLNGRRLKFIVSYACYMFRDESGKEWAQFANLVFGFSNRTTHVEDMNRAFDSWKDDWKPRANLPHIMGDPRKGAISPGIAGKRRQ